MKPYPENPGYKTLHPETSQQAAAAITSRAQTLRDKCLACLSETALTADEVAGRLGESVLAVRPRVAELAHTESGPRIFDTGQRRRNASGKLAAVWRAGSFHQQQLL